MNDGSRKLDVLIVGAGFAGLYMLLKARRQGLSARVVEAAAGIGGTWYHNRYPGARVDVQSMEYSFSFDDELQQQWQWSERYAPQPELLRYANHVADRFALRDGIQLNTRISGAHFDESTCRWRVFADSGESWTARFLVLASGPLAITKKRADQLRLAWAAPGRISACTCQRLASPSNQAPVMRVLSKMPSRSAKWSATWLA